MELKQKVKTIQSTDFSISKFLVNTVIKKRLNLIVCIYLFIFN